MPKKKPTRRPAPPPPPPPPRPRGPHSPDQPVLTPRGLQRLLHVGERAVEELLRRGLPFVAIADSQRFVRAQVLEWLAAEALRKSEDE